MTRTGTLDYRCMRGWSRNVFECERSVPHTRYDEPTLTPTCTTGTPTGGRCYTHQLPTKTCDNSDIAESERWELVGDVCKRTLTHTPTCPAGFPDLRGGLCRPTPPTTTPTTTPPTTTTTTTTAVPPSTPTTRAARPPGAPESLQLEPGDRQFTASWQPPADNGGSPVTGYTVRYKMGLLGIRQDVTTAVDALDRQPDGTLSRVIAGLTNDASYVVWVGAANPAGTTWTAAHAVTLPEVPRVRISGLGGAARIGNGTLADDFAVTPADATCTARITNPPPDGPPPTGAPAPTVTLTPDTGASRTVTVTANTPGPVTVQITCTHNGHNAAESAVFGFASPDGCDLPLTWVTKATIHQGEWSTSCTSKQRGNTQTPYYAKRYTFTLPTATTVAVDLKSSVDTYLYLIETRNGTTTVKAQNDDIGATDDSRLSVRLQPGAYTIEATTAAPRATGDFTLIIAPVTTDTAYHATVGEPWAAAFDSPATPSRHAVTPPDGLNLTLTHSVGTATVTATPTRAGFYNATFAYASQLGTAHSTITINVTCPEGHLRRTDRTCRAANSIPTDLVVPNDSPHGHKLYQVSQAALAGMVQAADEMNHNFQDKCAAIPERYRLTRNLLVALLVAVQYHEVRQDSDATEPEPASLMYLSRGDFYHTSSPGRQRNLHLYSLKTYSYGDKYDYPNAFWHPGVGLWQLDDANKYGSKLNHVQRAHATTAAANAAEIIHDNYCTRASESPSAPFTGVKIEDKIIAHLKWSLLDSAWWGCSKLEGLIRRPANCYPTLRDIVSISDIDSEYAVFSDTRSPRSDSPYYGRLYLNVDPDLTDEYGGGVTALTCEWTGARDGQTFDCDKYDISRANGHVGLSNVSSGTDPHNSLADDSQRSPLAYPFLSFTHTMTNSEGKKTDLKYIVFKSTDTGYTDTRNNRIDLIAAVPVGTNVRTDPSGNPTDGWWHMSANGWWHTNTVDGSGVRIVGPR
ncbi:MAG: fibronectin type III domain-containing protein [bacterium]|nr:fibronectin type III domain-containing protein [bacterium]